MIPLVIASDTSYSDNQTNTRVSRSWLASLEHRVAAKGARATTREQSGLYLESLSDEDN